MNRAWIPAGALAGVSVAGLLALAPLTDSLGTQVKFSPTVQLSSTLSRPLKNSVPVSVNLKTVGTVKTAALHKHGGAATAIGTGANADAGQVRVPIVPTTSTPTTPSKPATKAPTESDIKPKKQKRQDSIGGTTGSNGDTGLASPSNGTTGVGEQSNTPGG